MKHFHSDLSSFVWIFWARLKDASIKSSQKSIKNTNQICLPGLYLEHAALLSWRSNCPYPPKHTGGLIWFLKCNFCNSWICCHVQTDSVNWIYKVRYPSWLFLSLWKGMISELTALCWHICEQNNFVILHTCTHLIIPLTVVVLVVSPSSLNLTSIEHLSELFNLQVKFHWDPYRPYEWTHII